MMTHRVSEREQGELQGALQSMRSITFIIGPVLFSQTFSWFIDPKHSVLMPGAPFYLAALLLFTAMVMSTRIRQPEMSESVASATNIIPDVVPTSGVVPPEL
jgi:DHA1 family tetracycline resistance protein-like MFS transporter